MELRAAGERHLEWSALSLLQQRDYASAPDSVLASWAAAGDQDAAEALFRRHLAAMYALARDLLGNRDSALDVCQDVCVAALRSFGGLRGDNLGAWFRKMTANRSIDELRRRKRRGRSLDEPDQSGTPLAERLEAAGPDAAALAESAAFRADLQAALDELPEAFRTAFVLREGEELSYEEIAGILDVPIGTVRSRIHRARAALAERLKEWR